MKRKVWLLVSIMLILGVTACADETCDNQEKIESLEMMDDKTQEAYGDVLERLYEEHLLLKEDGEGYDKVDFEVFGKLSDNEFAIYDIDSDGQEELIIRFTTSSSAGMVEKIYRYDKNSDLVKAQFMEWPALTYYDNGIIKAGLSHNQGLGVDIENFWPYTLYQYDEATDSYSVVGRVDAWNKAYGNEDFDGNPFPDDIDKDGDGILYYVDVDEDYTNNTPIDFAEYEKWLNTYIGDANEVDVPYMNLTIENIEKLK